MTMGQDATKIVTITYENHRGEITQRRIEPLHFYFGSTEWHPTPQYLLLAFDHDKKEWRDFGMFGIKRWGE